MENTIITFNNPDENFSIILDISYNQENSELNWKINYENVNEDTKMNLTGALAEIFIEALQSKGKPRTENGELN